MPISDFSRIMCDVMAFSRASNRHSRRDGSVLGYLHWRHSTWFSESGLTPSLICLTMTHHTRDIEFLSGPLYS